MCGNMVQISSGSHSGTIEDIGASYTIPDCYRSGVTFISDRGLSYTTPHQSGTQRSD